jgi:hypothetical protein
MSSFFLGKTSRLSDKNRTISDIVVASIVNNLLLKNKDVLMLKKYQIFESSIFGTILFHVPEHSKTKNVSRVDVLQLTEHMATWRGARAPEALRGGDADPLRGICESASPQREYRGMPHVIKERVVTHLLV